jgi:hypothetical protein
MLKFKASLNWQPMTFGLIENTNKHNCGEAIDNDLKNVSCQRRRHLCSHPNNNLNNFFLKL